MSRNDDVLAVDPEFLRIIAEVMEKHGLFPGDESQVGSRSGKSTGAVFRSHQQFSDHESHPHVGGPDPQFR